MRSDEARLLRVPVDGGEFVVRVRGNGPSILLLHGGPGLTDYLDSLAEELASIGTVAHYQQRGLAPSPTTGDRSIEGHVADAVALLDALGWERACVVGHSWGGHLAMHLAIAHPERLTAVVDVDALGAVPDGGEAAIGENLTANLSAPERARLDELGTDDPSEAATPEDSIESLRILWPHYFAHPEAAPPMPDMQIDLPGHLATWESIHDHFAAGTLVGALPRLAVPCLVIYGQESPIPPSAAEATAALIPGARLVGIPDAGHLPWLEQPGSVRREVEAILR